MKLTVIGAGSTYTPELIDGLIGRREQLDLDEVVLLDTNPDRLELLTGMAQRMFDHAGVPVPLRTTTDLDAAVTDADAVLIQLRVGGQAARLVDETLPLRHGLFGQETTAAGGFAKALRTVPIVLDIAERVRQLAHPDAWIVDFTNPVGIVTRALRSHGHRAVGLCNFTVGFEAGIADFLGVHPNQVQASSVGLNHLSWVRAIHVDGHDRLPELLKSYAPHWAEKLELPVTLTHLLNAFPSYYLRYYYDTAAVIREQHEHGSRPRAAQVADVEAQLLRMYADPTLCTKPDLLTQRGGSGYSDAAAKLIASLISNHGDVQVVDTRNDGALPGLADDDIIEVPCRIDSTGATPLPLPALPPEMLGLVQAVTAYEKLTVQAATTGDRDFALKALIAHPLIREFQVAEPLLDDLLTTNRAQLPNFASQPDRASAGA